MYRKLGMYVLSALLMLLPVSAAFGRDAHAASSSRIAVIQKLSGDVQVQKAGGSKQFKAFAKLSLNQGDKLVTGSEGSAVLQFANGTSEDDKFTVGENATLTFSKLSDKKGTVTKVSMLKGTAWVDVKSIKSKDDDFQLETPTAIMGVRGTAFFASVNPATGGTNTAVMSGVVRLTSELAGIGGGSGPGGIGSIRPDSRNTIDLYPTQQIVLVPGMGQVLSDLTQLLDIEDIVRGAPPEVIEAMLRSKEKIDEENRQMVEKFKQNGLPPSIQQTMLQFIQNTIDLMNVIAKQAVDQKKVTESELKVIERQEKTSFGLDKDQLQQTEAEKAKQKKSKELTEEAAKKKAAEEAAKLKELTDKLNAAALKAIEAAKQAQAEANKKAQEEARARAEAELLRKLSEAERQKFEADKSKNTGVSTTTPSPGGTISANADLAVLSLSSGTLTPAFDPAVTSYKASVSSGTTSLVIGATARDSGASFTVSGQAPSGGQGSVNLAYGDNAIPVVVTAQNGDKRIYTVTVTRQLLNNVSVVFPGQNGINIDFNSTSAPAPLSIPSGSSNLTLVVPVTGPEIDIAVNGQNVEPEPMFVAARTILPGQISWRFNIPLALDANEIVIKATIDGVVKSYTLIAKREMSSEAAVKIVEALGVDGTTAYDVSTTGNGTWTVKVPSDTSAIKLKIVTLNGAAKVLLGGNEYASGDTIPYTIVNTSVPFRVRAADGTTVSFSLSIVRLPSSNASLSGLVLSNGTLSPVFKSDVGNYTASVGNATSSITVTPTAANSAAAIKVNNATVTSGKTSDPISLNVGPNAIVIEVTAQDGAKQKYTVAVTRENTPLAAPVFDPASGAVAFGTPVTIAAEGAEHIYFTTDGSDPASSASRQEYSSASPPKIEAAVTFKAVATRSGYPNSAIGSASYTQAVTADLTGLELSGEPEGYAFSANQYSYEGIKVSHRIEGITVTPTGAGTIMVDNVAVASGMESQPILLSEGSERTITIVAAETGKSPKIYALKVTRQPASSDTTLSRLLVSDGTLEPAFNPDEHHYTVTVPNEIASITVTATANSLLATVTGDGVHALHIGDNDLPVKVKAEDQSEDTYWIKVVRERVPTESMIAGVTSWTDTRSDDLAVVWHAAKDYNYEDVLYTELPDTSISLSTVIGFDDSVTYASIRKQGQEVPLGVYDGDASHAIAFDYGQLKAGDNVFILTVWDESGYKDDVTVDVKIGDSLQALAQVKARVNGSDVFLRVSHNSTYDFTIALPSPNASLVVYLEPENVSSELISEKYGIEMGSFFVDARDLSHGWNRIVVQLKDIVGHAAEQDTIINVWQPASEDQAEPASLSLNLGDMAFENDGKAFYPTRIGGFGIYNVTAHGTDADLSFFPTLADGDSHVEEVCVVNNEGVAVALSPDGEGKYSFNLVQGDNIEIVVRDSEGHRYKHRIHINHTLDPMPADLPEGVLNWSFEGASLKPGQLHSAHYYYASWAEKQTALHMTLALDPAVYSGAELLSVPGESTLAEWQADSGDRVKTIAEPAPGIGEYTLVLHSVNGFEDEEINLVVANGPASILGLTKWRINDLSESYRPYNWIASDETDTPAYLGSVGFAGYGLYMEMNFDPAIASDVRMYKAGEQLGRYVDGDRSYYEFTLPRMERGIYQFKLEVDDAGGETHAYDLTLLVGIENPSLHLLKAQVGDRALDWKPADGFEEPGEDQLYSRYYAIVPEAAETQTLTMKAGLVQNGEEANRFQQVTVDGVEQQLDDNTKLSLSLALTPGYHFISALQHVSWPFEGESEFYRKTDWIVFVGSPSDLEASQESGLDTDDGAFLLTLNEDHGHAPVVMTQEGSNYFAQVGADIQNAYLYATPKSPYGKLDVKLNGEAPYGDPGMYVLSDLATGSNTVTITVKDPTGTVFRTYTLNIDRAEEGGGSEPGTAPPAEIGSLSIGGKQIPLVGGQYEYDVLLPYAPTAAVTVHAVAVGQEHVSLSVNDTEWQWEDDGAAIEPDPEGDFVLRVAPNDGEYGASTYRIHVKRLLTGNTRIDGEVPVNWTAAGSGRWNSNPLELADGDWLRMNFQAAEGYELSFAHEGGDFDSETQEWRLASGVNKLNVRVICSEDASLAETYEFDVYNWNSVLVTNRTADKESSRVRAIKWNGVYYAAVPTSWFDGASEQWVGIDVLEGQAGGHQVGWNFTGSPYTGTFEPNDPANHQVTRSVNVYAPGDIPAFQAKFQESGSDWITQGHPNDWYNDERPGVYFWTNQLEMTQTGADVRVLQSEGDIDLYAMDDDGHPLTRGQSGDEWTWSLPLNMEEGGFRTFKAVVVKNGQTSVYLIHFAAGVDSASP